MESATVLKRETEVRRALEEVRRSLKRNDVATIEVSEDVLEFAVSEAIRQKLSIIDAYERGESIAIVLERRHE